MKEVSVLPSGVVTSISSVVGARVDMTVVSCDGISLVVPITVVLTYDVTGVVSTTVTGSVVLTIGAVVDFTGVVNFSVVVFFS